MAKITKEQAIAELARRKQARESQSNKGFAGVGEDVAESLSTVPEAAGEMISSIPGGIENVSQYATSTNPVSTFANLGMGGVESGAALLSAPQQLMRYLSDKFPAVKNVAERGKMPGAGGINEPTLHEGLMKFEQEHGLAAQSPEEGSVRNAGGLLFGGKALSNLSSMLTRSAALASEQAGRGGDPVHAAILGMLGESIAKAGTKGVNRAAGRPAPTPPAGSSNLTARIGEMLTKPDYKTAISNLPSAATNMAKAIPDAVSKIPEIAGQTAASALETAADVGTKFKIPGLQPTVGALASYLKHKSVAPEELAKRNLFGDITSKDLPKIQERQEAAKRLGLSFLTPGESLLSPFQTAKEANVGRTSAGAKLLYQKGKERVGTEATAIDSLLDSIYDEKSLSPEKKASYKDAMSSNVPEDFIAKWSQDPVVAKAIKQIDSTPEYIRAARNMPKDSFEYWNLVKRVVGDIETEDPRGTKKTKSDQATQARNEMVDEMDLINPRYKNARKIAEREFTRKDLEAVFDKKEMTLNNFWSLLKSDKKFNKIMDKLEPFPEAQQKLKDIRLLSNELIPFDDSIRTAYKLEKTGMTKDRNKLDALKRDLDERFGQEHDVAAVNLMTHPDFLPQLIEFLKKKGK